ncbi:MAG: hypothetical protein F4107_10255 [Gemmatimonadetes bacterium]|nr:hypothetical protein [Gemmatimonadota bacterium]MYD14207.1 hypothetical protein [Gemmatimonadota bacterium]MYI66297.1 hypothetical protein [Gemmatimonadota bacterium]
MIGRVLVVAMVGGALQPGSASAQLPDWLGPVGVEVRGGMSVGNHSESAAEMELVYKPSFDFVVRSEVIPTLWAFGGYYRTAFGCEEGFCVGRDITIAGNHGALGVEWVPRSAQLAAGPWLRGGILVGTTRAGTEGDPPDIGIGLDLGVGLDWDFGLWSARPGVSYRYLMANTPSSSAYAIALSGHLGIAIPLGGG